MTILYNTNYTHNANAYLTLAVREAAEAVFGPDNVVVADNRNLAELAAAGEHATLICLDGQRLHRQLIERVRPAFRTMVLWLFEDPFMLDYNLANADMFDAIFTNDPSCAGRYPHGHYLPLGASRALQFRPVKPDPALEYDIFFAGTMWPNRVATLRSLLGRFSDKRFKLICPTNPYLPPLPRDIAARAIQWPISLESFVGFANASRVTLTMFRDYASHGSVSRATAPGPRLFELAMAGTAQVVELDDAVPAGNFRVIEGVACCSGASVAAEIETLLASPAVRQSRAEAAQRSVVESHLMEHRLRHIAAVTRADFTHTTAAASAAATAVGPARRLRVLMCTHSTMRQPDWGGVEVYQQLLVSGLATQIEVLFWLRRGTYCTLEDSDGHVLEQFGAPEIGWLDNLTDSIEEMAFANVLCQYGIDVVHFQHLGHHTASLPMIAKSCGVGTVVSAHDFFLVCSRYNLLNHNLVFCDIGTKTITACDICLKIGENVAPGGQQTRRNFMAEMLRSVDVVLFGTAYSEQLTRRIYPNLDDKKCLVMGIPTPPDAHAATPPARTRPVGAPLRVAVIGNFLRSKGADTILNVIENVDPGRFQFVLLGKAEAQYQDVLSRAAYANVVYGGRYAVGDLDAMEGCDVSLHLSIWPETFCISLSETWRRGIIPIGTRIGAFADRITHAKNGFIVDVGDAAAVIGFLELLRADPATLAAMRASITPDLWIDRAAYAAALLGVYRALTPRQPLGKNALSIDAGQIHLLPHASWRDLAPPRHIFDPSRQSDIQLELPAEITHWLDATGARSHIDSVADCAVHHLETATFSPSDRFEVSGWAFVPNMGISGQVHVALVGDDGETTIFVQGTRHARLDIQERFPGAPQQAGFAASCRLQGKWSDGHYQLAMVIVFVDRAAVHLTALSLQLTNGRVVDVAPRNRTPPQISEAFHQVAERSGAPVSGGLTALPFEGRPVASNGALRHVFDDIGDCTEVGGKPAVEIRSARRLHLRGWAIGNPPAREAGALYVGLVSADGAQSLFWPSRRDARPDVSRAFAGAPEDAGFVLDLPLPGEGRWQVVLCNLLSNGALLELTRLFAVVEAGLFRGVGFAPLDEAARHAFLRRILPQAQAQAPAPEPSPEPQGDNAPMRRRARVK